MRRVGACGRVAGGILLLAAWLSGSTAPGETLTILNSIIGTTPARLGYNLGHFMPDSNAADWFRYSGADAARIFLSVSDTEPADDVGPVGDGVNSESAFFSLRALLRANGASTTAPLDPGFADWTAFKARLTLTASGNNRLQPAYAIETLRARGIAVLANLTASPSRFPVTGPDDWPGQWELWQHYYAHTFILARDYGVQQFGMFNEPNGWAGMTETDWLQRLRICSDAIQSAIADVNTRHGRSLVPSIFAPNTANGFEKYNTIGTGPDTTDTWGRGAVQQRHLKLDGTTDPAWRNFDVYNYQKYTTRTHASGSLSGYVTDYQALRGAIAADLPGLPVPPLALTEFNVRTGANYDLTTATQDSPSDYAALGANCVALTEQGIHQLYLFKFGQTASSSTYGVAKNGTHYVENGSAGGPNYGGATRSAEVYRLFIKAAAGGRPRLKTTATGGAAPDPVAGVWSLATFDAAAGSYHVFIANKETTPLALEVDFSALGLPAGQPVMVEEVSGTAAGGGVRTSTLNAGRLAAANLPAQAVWLITLPATHVSVSTGSATATTQLADGDGRQLPGDASPLMTVRADGTSNGRRVCLIRLPRPAGPAGRHQSIRLELDAATTSGTMPILAQVYGVRGFDWQESTLTWAQTAPLLRQNIPAGNRIQHNIVTRDGATAQILGQLAVDSPALSRRFIDVTAFVQSSPDPTVSFLVVQDHRWDTAQPQLTSGDTQSAGIVIASRTHPSGGPRLTAWTRPAPWVLWQETRFSANSGNAALSGPLEDPDRDGVVNLLEYALGGNPLTPDTAPLPIIGPAGGAPGFEFLRDPGQDDLRRTVQTASTPEGPWSDTALSAGSAAFAAILPGISLSEVPDGSLTRVTFRELPAPERPRRFFRLKVELLSP